jgi:hypothetical protein
MTWDENLTYLAIKKDTVDVKSKKAKPPLQTRCDLTAVPLKWQVVGCRW